MMYSVTEVISTAKYGHYYVSHSSSMNQCVNLVRRVSSFPEKNARSMVRCIYINIHLQVHRGGCTYVTGDIMCSL